MRVFAEVLSWNNASGRVWAQTFSRSCWMCCVQGYGELQELARDFWLWASLSRPYTGDDITRLERPLSFVADWRRSAIDGMKVCECLKMPRPTVGESCTSS